MAPAATARNSGGDRPEAEVPAPAPQAAVVADVAAPVTVPEKKEPTEESEPQDFDDATEAAFLAEARDRGELVTPVPSVAKAGPDSPAEDEEERAPLPALAELVGRIPAEVRETLEELYRAKFIAVRRVPAKALKAAAGERKSPSLP